MYNELIDENWYNANNSTKKNTRWADILELKKMSVDISREIFMIINYIQCKEMSGQWTMTCK